MRWVRAMVVAAAVAVLAGGCRGPVSDDRTSVGGGLAEGPTTPAPVEPAPATTAAPSRRGTPPPPPPPAGRSPTTLAAPSPAGTPDRSWQGPPGSYARTLLQPGRSQAVVLEVLQQDGAAPLSGSLSHVRSTVAEVSGKPVSLGGPVALSGSGRAWTADELRSLADEAGQADRGADRAVVRLLFLRGTFEGNDQVLGVAVRGDVLAVFTDRVASASSVVVPRASLEKAVTMHEAGHLLGLVGLVVNPGRQDPDHPGHSSNRRSVMYWAVESSLVGQILGGPPPADFDEADRADLAAIRNGA